MTCNCRSGLFERCLSTFSSLLSVDGGRTCLFEYGILWTRRRRRPRLAARRAAFTVIRTQSRMPPPPSPHSSWSSVGRSPSLSVSCRLSACQLGALTSSSSSSRRRSICLLGWQVSMQLFATLHIGRLFLSDAGPAYHARGNEQTNSTAGTGCCLPAPPSYAPPRRGERPRRSALSDRPLLGAPASRACSARPLLAARSTQKSEMGKSQMEIGYERSFMLPGREGAPRASLAPADAAPAGDVRLQRVMSSAIKEFHLSSLPRFAVKPDFAV